MKSVQNHPLLWSSIAGILLGLSFSPFDVFFLAIVGIMILVRIIGCATSFRHAMYLSFPGLLIWNAISTYWLIFATVTGGIAAILANTVIMTIPFGVAWYVLNRNLPVIPSAFLIASSWVGYEFLHYRWDLAWPWLTIGNAMANFPMLIQYVSWTGVLGASFWIVGSGSILALRWIRASANTGESSFMHAQIIWVVLLPILSVSMYVTRSTDTSGFTEVVVVQPNFDSYLPNAGYSDVDTPLSEIIALTDSVVTPSTEFIFWPENALQPDVHGTTERYPSNRLMMAAERWDALLVTGATWYKYYDSQTSIPPYARITGSGVPYDAFNAAIAYYPDGSMKMYEKANLVPIVERFPFYGFFSLIPIPGFDWTGIMGYGKGSKLVNFSGQESTSPALICYDSVFPDWVRRHVLGGADFVAIITNDGWWGDTAGHIQHFDFARIRAIETHRTIVRSANNGISGMILSDGSVHTQTEYWKRTSLRLQVPKHSTITFYTLWGDWLGWLSLLSLTIFGLSCVLIRLSGSKQ